MCQKHRNRVIGGWRVLSMGGSSSRASASRLGQPRAIEAHATHRLLAFGTAELQPSKKVLRMNRYCEPAVPVSRPLGATSRRDGTRT